MSERLGNPIRGGSLETLYTSRQYGTEGFQEVSLNWAWAKMTKMQIIAVTYHAWEQPVLKWRKGGYSGLTVMSVVA